MLLRFLPDDNFRAKHSAEDFRGLLGKFLTLFGHDGAGLGILGRSLLEPADGQQQGQRNGGDGGDDGAGLGHFGYCAHGSSQ